MKNPWLIASFVASVLGFAVPPLASSRAADAPPRAGEDWPQWRGPRLDGHSSETRLPVRWSATENVAWKAAVAGKGHSSPIVVGDRVFLTTCLEAEQKRLLLCLSRLDGHTLWETQVLVTPLEKRNSLNNYASSTPASDGKHVYVAFLDVADVRVVCYDLEGNEVWRKSPGKFRSQHGWAASPIIYKDTVILNCDQDAPKDWAAYVVAFDKETGAERWRIDRPNRIRSYCNPLIVEAGGKTQMVLTGSKSTAGYDPDTGRPYWLIDGPTEQFVASPVYGDGVFFVTGGFPTFHLMGIRPDGTGDVTATHVAWHDSHSGAYVPSPIADGKYFFVVSDDGQATCLEARTGRRLWSQKLGRHYRPSPVCGDGNLYFLGDDGETFVLKSGPSFELVSRNALGEDCYASPAVSRGQIFIRTVGSLYCIGK